MVTKIENKIIDILKKYFWIIILAFGFLGGLYVRKKGLYMVSFDMDLYILPWMNTLKENNGFAGLALNFSDYYIPYLCILAIGSYLDPSKWVLYVKAISIIFETAFAGAGALIAYKLLKENKKDTRWAAAVFCVLILSPMIVVNGSFWGQCDYIYGTFVLLAIYFLISEKYTLAMNMLGIALIFKFQTVFIVPVFVLVWLCNKKFRLWKFVFIPMWYLLGGLPAIIAGRPAASVYSIYLNQTSTYQQLTLNVPNIYTFFPNAYNDFSTWGIIATAGILFVLALWAVIQNCELSNRAIVGLCMCTLGICGMFLPAMHERYITLYVGFVYIYYLIYSKKKVVIAGVLDMMVCMTYFWSLWGTEFPREFAVVTHMGILFFIIYDVVKVIKEDKSIKDEMCQKD